MYKQCEFTRQELYQMVWARPLLAIARDIGVSDVALGKACRRAGIPLPGRGHWAALKTGKVSPLPPLPDCLDGQADVIQFSVLSNPPVRVPKPAVVAVAPIEIPAKLLKPHLLVAQLRDAASNATEDKGVLWFNYEKFLRVRSSRQHLGRALILMDVLIKQFEALGHSIRIGPKWTESELVLKEGTVSFRLDERTTRTEPPPPPPKPARKGRHETDYSYEWRPRFLMVATGEFTLEFGRYRLDGCRKTWKDRPNNPIEAQLHEVIEAIPSWEAWLRSKRLAEEEREAREREAERRRIAAARAEELLRRQRATLVSDLHAWERAERLRAFLAAAKAKQPLSPEGLVWVRWVEDQIGLLDPITADVDRVTQRETKLEGAFQGRPAWDKSVPKGWWG